MSDWLTAVAAGVAMYLLRGAVPLVAGRRALPERVVDLTRLAAPAVIAALLAGSLVASSSPAELLARLVVVAVGLAVAVRTRSIPWTIGAGLAAHALLGVLT